MSAYNKVLWSEGLFLRPQHFQQQGRYFERLLETRCFALRSHPWGCVELEFERDMLSIGKLALRRAVGVFPDGTPFRIPDDDVAPTPLDVGTQVRDETVYLALPVRQANGAEVDRSSAQEGIVRHSIREIETRDATSDAGITAPLEVGPLRARLMLSHESLDDYARVPIAQIIERRSDQRVMLDDRFMPTVMDVRAAPVLATFMTELQGLLHQRGEALAGRVSATGRGGAAEIADFLMLQAINRYEPLITHLVAGGLVHPEDFYRFCVAAAGELATFTTVSKRPGSWPTYAHDRLRESFDPVIAALRSSLSAVLEQSAISIPIEPKKFGLSVATVADRTLFGTAVFVLAVRADTPAEELRRRFPSQLKIGPVEKIRDLVNLQLPGIALQPIPVAPRQIPYHAGFVYFELDQANELWSQLKVSGGIALHVGGEFPGLKMEFWAIRG
ncbi:MAG TPA: type VI secretion system baseplate subunit TssK [Steroidobacteraceae bacterium]|nr:type VI secretion system baseplate subunit TssK [Steroidobacteraceae bacterium]